MLKYMKSHLTVKIFLITAALFFAVAAVTYGFIVLYVPRYYLVEAKNLEAEVQLSSSVHGQNRQSGEVQNNVISIVPKKQEVSGDNTDNEGIYSIQFVQTAKTFSLTLQKLIIPLLLVALIAASIVALFYSRYITRPIIRISEASKRLAALDFEARCKENRSDELGALSDHLNELSGRLATALDELKSANAVLKADMEREKELESQQLAFFSSVSHELKTPITILKGQLQGMIYHVGGYKDRDTYLKRSFEVACSMEDLVKEILTVTRIKSSNFNLQKETISLPELISEILGVFEELFIEKQIKVTVDLEPCSICADRPLFTKVISNLISNAYHYSPEGAQIKIHTAHTGRGAECCIENTGVQIPEPEIPGLFEAFARREQSRNRETGGSGLGLAIVRMALDLHGFTYSMENTGDGVRFTIVSPAAGEAS